MKPTSTILLFSFIFSTLVFAQQAPLGRMLAKSIASLPGDRPALVLITFRDKGNTARFRSARPADFVSERSLKRRALVRPASRLLDEADFPVSDAYVDAITPRVTAVRHVLKWFNAVSAMATPAQIRSVRNLPFVAEIELVGRWRKNSSEDVITPVVKSAEQPLSVTDTNRYSYGGALTQVKQIGVPALHNMGIIGQGVVVGVFDNGFRNPHHQAFDSMKIIATYDFVDHKVSVVPNNPADSIGAHGVNTLSTIGGYRPGSLIGPAFGASFILARTENDTSETPVEEDNWAAAIQWADSIGVDVTSTSLGYLTYDPPYTSWTWQDMNGHTTLITNAADHAVGLGIVVLNSAGNNGAGDGSHNTLNAPADGDSVITVGAVTSGGVRTGFSSIGPTTDVPARIKPDIMAMGSGVTVASATDTVSYGLAGGTSFSCPLSAGVAALIRCANPTLTPMQVLDALKQTASRHLTPDNYYGWGIINGGSAALYAGILPLGKLHGVAFLDHNANGVRDPEDEGIPGIVIHSSGSKTDSAVTDANGAYTLDSLPVGSITITRTLSPGSIASSPGGGSYTTSLLFHADTTGFDFGSYSNDGVVKGVVFNDSNVNAVHDLTESGMTYWKVRIAGPITVTTFTDSTGTYVFNNLPPGNYAISESLKAGWAQTFPAGGVPYNVSVLSNHDTSGFEFGVANLPAMTYPYANDWNLLSLPQDPVNHSVNLVYQGFQGPAYMFNGAYQPLFVVPNGIGYWLRAPGAGFVTINGNLRTVQTVALADGWNLVGSLSYPVPVSSIVDSAGIVASPWFGYSSSYLHADTIQPSYGYWVKTNGAGSLTMYAFPPPVAATAAKRSVAVETPMDEFVFTDANGRTQVVSAAASLPREASWYQMPPVPPPGGFDVRFASGTSAVSISGSTSRFPLMISATYPLTVEWRPGSSTARYSIEVDGATLRLAPGSKVFLQAPVRSIVLSAAAGELPREFALRQNFPNPFNPTTVIGYDLPVAAKVRLVLLDLLGREVQVLVDREAEAGSQSVTVDASRLSSGVYFYRLTAGTFTSVRKMMLLR